MRVTVIVAIVAALLGFVAVYASLTLRGNGESQERQTFSEKTQKMRADRLRAFIFHKNPKALPDFEFLDVSGTKRSLKDWRGKVVLLNLWATWCGPCREEMPSLDNLKANFGGQNFDVLAISMDRGGIGKVQNFYGSTRIKNLELYIDPSAKLMFKLKAVGLPATILIDAEGREIGRMPGPAQWDSDRAIELIKGVLSKG